MNGEGYGPVVTVLETYMRTAVGLSSLELQPEHMMVYSDRNLCNQGSFSSFFLYDTGHTTSECCGLWCACHAQYGTVFIGWC